MLLGAISKKLDKIVEFTAFEDFYSFEKKGKNKVKRVQNHKIKVTIEVDMVCVAVCVGIDNYKATDEQRKAVFSKIKRSNYEKMKENVAKLSTDDFVYFYVMI